MVRRGVPVSNVVNLNNIVLDYLKTPEFANLKKSCPLVKITTKLEKGLLNIKVSPVHLAKSIMNIISDAAESISGK